MAEGPDHLRAFVDEVDRRERSLVVANRTRSRSLQSVLESVFEAQSVSVDDRTIPEYDDDVVLLVDSGEVVAASPLESLERSLLLINSDAFVTGERSLETVDPPAVIRGLEETPFRVRGYPAAHKEKLLLIAMSRYVERLARTAGGGTLRTAFQRLSRMDDERGTRATYRRLAAADVDVHVYGVPDRTPTLDVTVHGGTSDAYRNYWVVVHVPPADGPGAALIAYESGPNEWTGLWTFDRERVERIDRFVVRRF